MPYIKSEAKLRLATKTNSLQTAGELNYSIARLIDMYCENIGINYQAINDVVGALDSVKAEFQRRFVGPYEDMKIAQNGEVFTFLADRLQDFGRRL